MVVEIVVNGKIRKKHYLQGTSDFWIDCMLSSYGEKTALILKEKIKDLIIEQISADGSEKSVEAQFHVEGISYRVKVTNQKSKNPHPVPELSGNNLPPDLHDALKERAYRTFRLYTKYDLY